MSALPPALVAIHAPPQRVHGEISQRLRDPLDMVAARARFLALLRAFFQFTVVTAATWLVLVLLLGSIRELPVWLAILLAALAWLVLFGGLIFFFRPALRHHDLSDAARMSDTAVPENHERLYSAIELTQEADPRFHGSPELIAALVRQAEHAAEQLDPAAIVSGGSVFRWFLGLIPLCLTWLILLIVLTSTLALGFSRLIQPWHTAAPLPTATLDVDPQNVTVAQGESVTINLSVTPVASAAIGKEKPIEHATLTRRYSAGGTNEEVSADMERTGNRTFRALFENVQQTFSYHIASEGSQSPTYVITVQQRPAANSIQVDYTYPAYTHRPPHTETTRDGSIDALVGSTVKLTLDISQPLKSAQLSITDNTPYPSTMTLTPPLPSADSPTKYTTQFTIRKSTDYRLHLINQKDLENSDTQPRPIIARLDAPPQISINSPADAALKVRVDDAVPIKYTATDDFAVTRIDLITQVDDQLPVTTPLPNIAAGQSTLTGLYTLSIHDVLGPLLTLSPKRIAYQFRVTDNREPDPQTGLSMKQVLLIDRGVAPLAERQDAQAARTLGEAVQRAASSLDDAKQKIDTLRQTAAARPLTDAEKQQAAEARRDLDNAAQSLQSAADKSNDSRLAESAKQAKEIADQPIRQAQENTAASQLAADQPDARNKSLDAASQNIDDARQKLYTLGHDIGLKAKDQPLAHELERIAAEQRRIADGLAQNPNDPKLLQQQRQLQQDLEKVIKDHPDLQKPATAAAQAQADDLAKKLADLKQSQQPLNDSAKAQKDAALSQDKLNDLANKQETLNQKMQQFSSDQNDALRQANAKTPDPQQTAPISKDLQSKNLPSAAQAQNAAAAQMEETAQRLENEDKRQHDPANQNTAEHAAQTAKDTQALKDQTDQLRQQIEDAQKNHNPPTRPSDPANQQATKLADQLHRQAQQMAQSPANRQAAKQASDEADAAKRDAAQGNATSAQQHLANAASQLDSAAKNQQQTASPSNAAKDPAQAAAQARQLAQEQRDLANQTQQTNQSLNSAQDAQNNSQQTAQQQQALADKMENAAKSAKALQQQTQGSAPDLSQRAGETAQQLQKAADAQHQAAQANQSGDSQKAASQQQQAQGALSSAQQSMSSQQSSPSGSQSSGSPGGQQSASGNSPSNSQQSPSAAQAVQAARNAQSQAASGNPAAARQAADQLAQASQQLINGTGNAPSSTPSNAPGNNPSPSMAQGSAPGDSSGAPGSSNGSPTGKGTLRHPPTAVSAVPLPKSVEEIGVSPSDWARLPPNTQQQLLNSAQQSGPPAYRDMIKNYYSRIAHLDDTAPPSGAAK